MTKIVLPKLDKDLLKECKITTCRSSGAGGQHVNVTDTAIRLTHIPTGIVVRSQKHRSQHLNKMDCLEKLRKVVEKRNYRKPKRIPTRMPKSVKIKNILKQQQISEKKRFRRPPSLEDD